MNQISTRSTLRRALLPALIVMASALPSMASTPVATATVLCDKITINASVSSLPLGVAFSWQLEITVTTSNGPINLSINHPFDAGGFSSYSETFDIPISATGTITNVTGSILQLENGNTCGLICGPEEIDFDTSNLPLTCSNGGGGGTGCPATIGFWKNKAKHPFPASVQTNGLTIGGVSYSAAQLDKILNNNGGNAVVILGRQLVGSLLNLAAGAKHHPAADAAIATANALLSSNNLNLLTSSVGPSTTLGQALLTQATILDAYNNGYFNTCSHGDGLVYP